MQNAIEAQISPAIPRHTRTVRAIAAGEDPREWRKLKKGLCEYGSPALVAPPSADPVETAGEEDVDPVAGPCVIPVAMVVKTICVPTALMWVDVKPTAILIDDEVASNAASEDADVDAEAAERVCQTVLVEMRLDCDCVAL